MRKLNKESSEYRLRSAKNEISLNVIQQFFQYQYDKAWLEVLQTQISGIEEQIKHTEKEVEIETVRKATFTTLKPISER